MERVLKVFISLLLCSLCSSKALALEPSKADALMQEGAYWLQQGRYRDAIQVFKAAQQEFINNNQDRFAEGVDTYISQAQWQISQPTNACWSLLELLPFGADVCKAHVDVQFDDKQFKKLPRDLITISALQNLAIISRTFGKYQQSLELLENAIAITEEIGDTQPLPNIKLTQAHTLQAILADAIEYQQHIDPEHVTRSQTHYLDLSSRLFTLLDTLSDTDNPAMALRGSLSWLSAYVLISDLPIVISDGSDIKIEAQQKIEALMNVDFGAIRGADGVKARQQFISILLDLDSRDSRYLERAYRLGHESYNMAEQLDSNYLRSLSLGNLGRTDYLRGNTAVSLKHLISARNLAIAHFMPGLANPWDWELAKIYADTGYKQKALTSYKSSLASLQEARGDLLTNPRSLQRSFHKKVEPIYKEYLRLLLADSEPDLEKIVRVFEEYQQISIENYLRCGKLNFSSIRSDPKHKTVLYFIDLDTEYHTIIKVKDTLKYYKPDISVIRKNTKKLNLKIQTDSFKNANDWESQQYSEALYNELIRPVEHLLTEKGEITYVSTGLMESIPLSMLHTGNQYLIERYPINASLGSQLVFRDAKAHKRSAITGVGNSPLFRQLGLSQLPSVYAEVEQISATQRSTTILDKAFRLSALRKQLDKGLSTLHIATHGQFSSDPEQTYLLAWDRPIKTRQFDALLYDRITSKRSPIDLLFLSACETAKGDRRARLGLAGLAVQAGARSTIASLWKVNDRSTGKLAVEFYRGYGQGLSKAEALRQAQLKLLKSAEYSHPYYWAAFILVGDGG